MRSSAHPRPVRPPVAAPPPTGRSRSARLGIPPALTWGFVGVLLFMTGDGVETGFFSKYLADHGLAKADAAVIIAVYGITVAVGAWLSGALSDLWGPRRVMTAGFAIWLVFQVLMLTVALPAMNYWLLLLIYGLRGFGYPLFAYGFLVWVTAATPPHRLGTAVGWYWFAFTGGLPTLGSLVAGTTIPLVGSYDTLWIALGLVALGGLLALLLVREPTGRTGLAPDGGRALATLAGSISIMRRRPRVAVGAAVRVFSTGSQFGFLVCLPFFFTETVGFSTSAWLRLLSVMFAANIFANLFFGAVGDRLGWQRTMTWFGAVACAVTCLGALLRTGRGRPALRRRGGGRRALRHRPRRLRTDLGPGPRAGATAQGAGHVRPQSGRRSEHLRGPGHRRRRPGTGRRRGHRVGLRRPAPRHRRRHPLPRTRPGVHLA